MEARCLDAFDSLDLDELLNDTDLACSTCTTIPEGLQRCFSLDVNGMIRRDDTQDMTTYMVRLSPTELVTLAKQVCSIPDFQRYVNEEEAAKVGILHSALIGHVDQPAFLTMGQQVASLEPFSPFVLMARVGGADMVLGIGNFASKLVPQGGAFELRHPMCPPEASTHVVKAVMRFVLERPLTWCDSLEVSAGALDTDFWVAMYKDEFQRSLAGVMGPYYRTLEDPGDALRILIPRTYFAAGAMGQHGNRLLFRWTMLPDVELVAPIRLLMVARLLYLGGTSSSLPSFVRFKDVVAKGAAYEILGETMDVPSFSGFCERMRHMQTIVPPTAS